MADDFCSAHSKITEHIGSSNARLKNIEADIKDIKVNDLAHIYKRLNSIKNWLISILSTMLGTLIVGLFLWLIRINSLKP